MTIAGLLIVGIESTGRVPTRLWSETMDVILLLKANMDAIAPRLVFDKPYRRLTNETADPNVCIEYIHGRV